MLANFVRKDQVKLDDEMLTILCKEKETPFGHKLLCFIILQLDERFCGFVVVCLSVF